MVRLIAMDRLNGILAVSLQPQYLQDVRRWIEVLDREGENNTRRMFVYRVQNGRASDLARTLAGAFGQGPSGKGDRPGGLPFSDTSRPPGVIGVLPSDAPVRDRLGAAGRAGGARRRIARAGGFVNNDDGWRSGRGGRRQHHGRSWLRRGRRRDERRPAGG